MGEMSYKYEDSCRTQKGKVIYPRKKHEFQYKDLYRIYDGLRSPDNDFEEWLMISMIHDMLFKANFVDIEGLGEALDRVHQACRDTMEELSGSSEFQRFSGGKFGGGGATRPWIPKRLPRPW
jgi:hypothetical protein